MFFYHIISVEWMKGTNLSIFWLANCWNASCHVLYTIDPYLIEMTASEPLTLEEEYEMQATWRDDPYSEYIVVDSCAVCMPVT